MNNRENESRVSCFDITAIDRLIADAQLRFLRAKLSVDYTADWSAYEREVTRCAQ